MKGEKKAVNDLAWRPSQCCFTGGGIGGERSGPWWQAEGIAESLSWMAKDLKEEELGLDQGYDDNQKVELREEVEG